MPPAAWIPSPPCSPTLAGKLTATKLAALAVHFERAILQRLGYLLDRLGHSGAAEPLHKHLFANTPVPWVRLEPSRRKNAIASEEIAEKNERWHVAVQRHPEIDE